MVEPTGYTALDLVGFTDKGTYSSSATYVKNDLVDYGGDKWQCMDDDVSNVTPTEGAYWHKWIDIETVRVGTSGSGTAASPHTQNITVNGTPTAIEGTKYMESSSKTTASGTDTFTFTNAPIDANSVFDFYCDVYGIAPSSVTVSGTTLTVNFASNSSLTKCRVYIR